MTRINLPLGCALLTLFNDVCIIGVRSEIGKGVQVAVGKLETWWNIKSSVANLPLETHCDVRRRA